MAYTGIYERTIFYNPVNKYSVISVKTSDRSIPEKARSAYRHRDNMIHFAAVGYELPRTDQVSMILDGEWKEGKNGFQLHVTKCEEVVPQTREGIKGYLSSRLIKGIGGKTAELIVDRFGADTLHVLENEPERLLEIKTIFKVVKKKCHCDCPGRDVELPAYRGKKIEVFSDHEIALLAQKILEAPDITGLCILLVLNTGLRLGEICALRKSDIDYRSGFLRIERSAARVRDASGTHLVVQSPKSGSSVRLVAIPNDMLELLKATTQSIQRDNYLLTNTDTPMEPRTLQYRYRKLLERCGIRYRNFHALRHTYATRCMENGVDIKSLSELLGHADVRTTLQTYIHSSLAHKRQAVQSICFLPMEGAGSVLIPSKIPSEISAITVPPSKTGTCFVNCI